jgi:hypothetical protein
VVGSTACARRFERRAPPAIFLRAMEPSQLPSLGRDFVLLLLLPTLGVLGLMHKRAVPVLRWTLVAWLALGIGALLTGNTLGWSPGASCACGSWGRDWARPSWPWPCCAPIGASSPGSSWG